MKLWELFRREAITALSFLGLSDALKTMTVSLRTLVCLSKTNSTHHCIITVIKSMFLIWGMAITRWHREKTKIFLEIWNQLWHQMAQAEFSTFKIWTRTQRTKFWWAPLKLIYWTKTSRKSHLKAKKALLQKCFSSKKRTANQNRV